MNVMDDADHAKRLLDDELLQRVLNNMVSDLQLLRVAGRQEVWRKPEDVLRQRFIHAKKEVI